MGSARRPVRLQMAQRQVWANKQRKGFNTTDVPYEMCLLHGELAELFDAWRKKEPVSHELADIAIYVLGLSEMLGVDLETAINEKMLINDQRRYVEMDGVLTKRPTPPESVTSAALGTVPTRTASQRLRVVGQEEVLF